jgi:hypothetical protein
MIKNLIKEKKSINSILKHLIFKNNQIINSYSKLENEIHHLNEKTLTNIEKLTVIKFLIGFYKGEVDKNGLPHNRGFMIYPNTDDFTGDFECGNINGQGFMRYKEKNYQDRDLIPIHYCGEWLLDYHHGLGKYTFKDQKFKIIFEKIGEFYFGYLNGFGRTILEKDNLNKSKISDDSTNNTTIKNVLFGYYLNDTLINFYLDLQIDNEFQICGKSGLYFIDEDQEIVLLHQFEKIDEYNKIEEMITSQDEKMPDEFLSFYHNYFNHEIKTNKFKELFCKIKRATKNLVFYSEGCSVDDVYLEVLKLNAKIIDKLSETKSIKELEEIDIVLKEIYIKAEKLNKLK